MINKEEIPEHWELERIDESFTLINGDRGENYPSKPDITDKGIPFITTGNIEQGEVNLDDSQLKFITKEKYDSLQRGKLKDGDFLICLRGSVGKFGIFNANEEYDEGFINAQLVILRPFEDTNREFMNLFFNSPIFQRQIERYTTGGAQPQISAKNLAKIVVPMPPRDEQERIIEVVGEQVDRIEKLAKSVGQIDELTREYENSLLAFLFSGKDDLSSGSPEQIPTDGDIPDDWDIKTFDEVTKSSLYGCNPTTGEDINGVPYLRISDISENGGLKYLELPEKAQFESSENKNKYLLSDGDIVIARSGASSGQSYVYNSEHNEMVYASYLIRFTLNQEIVSKEYIREYLKSPIYWNQVTAAKKGAAQNNINAGDIKSFQIPVPPLDKQQKIVERIRSVDMERVHRAVKDVGKLFEEYRDSVLSRAFKQVPDDGDQLSEDILLSQS